MMLENTNKATIKLKTFPLSKASNYQQRQQVFAKITVTDALECGLNFRDSFSVGTVYEIVRTVTSRL